MEKGINTEKDFEIAKKIAHVLSGDCSEENRSSLDEWLSESEGNRNLYERILDERNREAFQKNAAKFDRSVGWEKLLQKRRQRTTGRQIQMHRRVLRWVAVVTLVFVKHRYIIPTFNGMHNILQPNIPKTETGILPSHDIADVNRLDFLLPGIFVQYELLIRL